jgi:hypothetical protein
VHPLLIVEDLDVVEELLLGLARRLEALASSAFSVLNQLSIAALS